MAGHEKHLNEKGSDDREVLVWQSSLASAKQCILKKNYGRAFAHFLLVLKLCPGMKSALKDDFVLSMREWTEGLERQGRMHDMFKCYDQACELFPECEAALNNIGAQLFRLGYTDEAALYVRRALKLCPDFLAARENLENICSHLVERWHFRMLNDMTRNRAFRDGIDLAVTQGFNTVLDIGAGTGLLSLFAEEAGAVSVHACEVSKSMCDVAAEIITANCSASDKINLIPKLSLDLSIPQDIPSRVSLVVTETFDAGLFGEHIVSTLHHAWEHLLLPPAAHSQQGGGRVIPAAATVYLCPVESETIRKGNRLLYPVLLNLDLRGIDLVCQTSVSGEEPYTTERLSAVRAGYRQLAPPKVALKVNFCDPQEVAALYDGLDMMEELHINQGGKLDAVAMWFDLDLDKNVTITTAPHIANCWDQAVFPVLASHFRPVQQDEDVRENFAVKEGDTVSVNCSLQNDCFRVLCRKVTRAHSPSRSDDKKHFRKRDDDSRVYSLSHCEISRLNDITLNRHYLQALEATRQKIPRSTSLLDLSDGLSPLGLQAALIGYSDITMTTASEETREILCHIADINSITRERLSFIQAKEILDMDMEFDTIVVELLESSGVFRQQILEDLALTRLTSMTGGGVVLPGKLTVMGMCVESEDLAKSSFVVTSEYTLGYQIADFIRDFQATTHPDIDLHTLTYKKLCEPFELFQLDFNEDRSDSDLPSFLQQEKEVSVFVTDTGCVHAVVYWFEVQVMDDIRFSTLDPSLHWRQAAKMMGGQVVVSAGQTQTFKLLLKNSCIDVKPAN
ncbi:protein arginine N-methyltransferase 9-like [Haliotis cracherodii]|uniref:protein arginine N-methyltransferase 9-like n=1 Tax=Haliotis cracherodii TaxID=6455 RepID=UPI0039E8D965